MWESFELSGSGAAAAELRIAIRGLRESRYRRGERGVIQVTGEVALAVEVIVM